MLILLLHCLIFLCLFSYGLYVLIEHKVFLFGKLTGGIHYIEFPGYLIISISLFVAAIVSLLVLNKKPYMKKVNEGLIIIALILHTVGVFLQDFI